jgi:hypothetical protein
VPSSEPLMGIEFADSQNTDFGNTFGDRQTGRHIMSFDKSFVNLQTLEKRSNF